MKRAVIYARVSTDAQAEEGLSVDSQIESCRRRAMEMDAAVLAVYRDDGISGSTDIRPGFQAAIEHCRAAEPDFLIVWSSSRFARNQRDAIVYKAELAHLGTRLVYASQGIDLATDEGWMLDSVQQIFDEAYSRQVSKDTRRSMIAAAREGYFMGGRVPFGYRAAPAPADPRRTTLLPHDDEAVLVQQMYQQSARQVGALALAAAFNGDGLTLRGRPWAKNSILNILKSEVYMGQVIFNRFDRKLKRERPPSEWIRVNAYPALVTPELWQQVQHGLATRSPRAENTVPTNSDHLFAGLLRCACGNALMMATGNGRGGKTYFYYACRADLHSKRCNAKRLPADRFDAWMLDELVRHVITPDNMAGVLAKLDTAAADWVKDRDRRRSALVLELRTAEGRRSKLYDVLETHGKDAPGIHELGPRLRELGDQIKRLELALTAIEDEQLPDLDPLDVDPQEAAQVMRDMIQDCQSKKALRAFIASIIEQIDVLPGEVRVAYHPECLVLDANGAAVRSTRNWLPVVAMLRTVAVTIARPDHFGAPALAWAA